LQYPVDVILKDGTTVTINNDEEMKRIYAYSSGDRDDKDRGRKPGFEFVYPVTYIMPDGSTVTGNDEKEVGLAMKAWYEANPDSRERPALQYPVDVILKDGTTVTVNNDEEMQRIYAAFSRGSDTERGGDNGGNREGCQRTR